MTENNAAQASIDVAIQMLGTLACLVQPPGSGASKGFTISCATVRTALEPVVEMLSKLRAEGVPKPVLGYPTDAVADATIKAAYEKVFGTTAGWEDYAGSYFVEGYQAALASAPVADTLPLEKALYELVDKIAPGLDTGDLVQDARRASTLLDAIMASAPVADTPSVDALMAKWDDDGATRGPAFIELRDLARELERRVSAPVAGEADAWRRLALQFDGHRMQALGHLRVMLADPQAHADRVTEFLAAPPLSGEQVLAERIRALAAPQASEAGIELAAAWVDKRRQDFDHAHGYMEPDTGAWSFGRGDGATAKEEYSAELAEIAEGLRALKTQADKDGGHCAKGAGAEQLK